MNLVRFKDLSPDEKKYVRHADEYQEEIRMQRIVDDASEIFPISDRGALENQIMGKRVFFDKCVRKGNQVARLWAYAPNGISQEDLNTYLKFFNLEDDPLLKEEIRSNRVTYGHYDDGGDIVVELVKNVSETEK